MDKERIKKIIEKGCPLCKGELEDVGYRKVRCKGNCKSEFKFRKQERVTDMNDSSTWKATCDECGGIMDYGHFSYHCGKCGNVLEV